MYQIYLSWGLQSPWKQSREYCYVSVFTLKLPSEETKEDMPREHVVNSSVMNHIPLYMCSKEFTSHTMNS